MFILSCTCGVIRLSNFYLCFFSTVDTPILFHPFLPYYILPSALDLCAFASLQPFSHFFLLPFATQEQINSLVSQVCGRAMLKNGGSIDAGGVIVSGGGGDPCHGLSPAKASPAKRGPRKRATVEVSLARLSSSHMPKAAAVSWGGTPQHCHPCVLCPHPTTPPPLLWIPVFLFFHSKQDPYQTPPSSPPDVRDCFWALKTPLAWPQSPSL